MPTPLNPGAAPNTGLLRTSPDRAPLDANGQPVTQLKRTPTPNAFVTNPFTGETAPTGTTFTQPGAATGLTGSPLNTLYGVDSESYLTPDQQNLARMIQGKFSASADRRDRELQRFGAPRLSSFAEDESLARAMAQAQGLNYRAPVDPLTGAPTRPSTRLGPLGNGVTGRGPIAAPPGAPTNTHGPAQWQRILSGLASIAPLLFGKDAYGQFLNKGLLGTIKEKLFGPGASNAISDAQLEQAVSSGQLPGVGDAAGGYAFNPITGMPMTSYGGVIQPGGGAVDNYESLYQGGNSAGNYAPNFDPGSWSDWNWGSGAGDLTGWTPDLGGDPGFDLFGGV